MNQHYSLHKMSRKRYIKLLMALGADRNDAVILAEAVPATGKTYHEAYLDFLTFLNA